MVTYVIFILKYILTYLPEYLNTPSLRLHLYVLKLGMMGLVGMELYIQRG